MVLPQKLSEAENQVNKRTSSGRAVKRKRFADEIIECGLKKDKHKIISPSSSVLVAPPNLIPCPQNSFDTLSSENISEDTPQLSGGEVDLWSPEDHFKLIYAVINTCDIQLVHKCVTFSHDFSLFELNQKWNCLLRQKQVLSLSNIHPGIVRDMQRNTPLKKSQEEALSSIPVDSEPDIEVFKRLKEKNGWCLSSRRLQSEWWMRREFERGSDYRKFYKMVARAEIACGEDVDGDDSDVDVDESIYRRKRKYGLNKEMERVEEEKIKEIEKLEREVALWKQASNQSDHTTHFDEDTYAVIEGHDILYKMKTQQIVVGRKTTQRSSEKREKMSMQPSKQADDIDIDLGKIAMSHKISRKHFTIRLLHHSVDSQCNQGSIEFVLTNLSRRPVMVNYKEVLLNQKCTLLNHSVIQIGTLMMLTLHMNTDLLPTLTHPTSSTTTIYSSSSCATISN